jgi:hypothetical protein
MNRKIILVIALLVNFPAIAHACLNPVGEEGDQVYNITYHVMQYCNGTNWIAMGSHAGAGGTADNLGNHMAAQALDMGGFRIENLAPPSAATDAASKAYVDAAVGGGAPNLSAVLTAGNAAGNKKITGLASPTVATDATTKQYVDNALTNKISKAGDTMTGHLNVPLTPTADGHAASKQYVDNAVSGSGGLPACSEGDTLVMGAAVWECRSAPTCDGFVNGGVCWVLSSPGGSCENACYSRGGYNDATRTFAGSAGSDANCMSILTSLGAVFDPEEFQSEELGLGLGCLAATNGGAWQAYRDTYETTAAASYPGGEGAYIRRACACNAPPAEDACTTGPVGTACADGAVYLGTVGGNRIYAAAADEPSTFKWDSHPSMIVDADADSLTDGLANTTWMAAQGAYYSAALACATKAPAGTWYLPARDELALLWDNGNRKSPPGQVNLTALGIHASSYYWSSTEYNISNAWVQRFSDGNQNGHGKNTGSYTQRCVRR